MLLIVGKFPVSVAVLYLVRVLWARISWFSFLMTLGTCAVLDVVLN